jgi:beta-amyrin synthase
MWRLKIADGGKDPNIFSLNNFVGRQTWEFDPHAGTPEERAQVEKARQHFYDNRFKVKSCGDLFCRFQVVISFGCSKQNVHTYIYGYTFRDVYQF